MSKPNIVIIGAGASGLTAAIAAARAGASVTVCERLSGPGKKILASGNGRCNLLNEELDEKQYNASSRTLVKHVLGRFSLKELGDFFGGLGLFMSEDAGRIFPATNQSASVLKVLELELGRLGVTFETNFEAVRLEDDDPGFRVLSQDLRKITADRLIIACGGKSYPALGSNGSGYRLAEQYGHTLIKPVPVAVPLMVKDRFCHVLQGQKIKVYAESLINGKTGGRAFGDVLFTAYGLSGTAILDISRPISIAINRSGIKDIQVALDLAPFMEKGSLERELNRRLKAGWSSGDLLSGILPGKFSLAMSEILAGRKATDIAAIVKNKGFTVNATRGWNEAEFTAGGIKLDKIKENSLESKLRPGLFFCGEVLDVDGGRGGFNLSWAWASGLLAGSSAASGV